MFLEPVEGILNCGCWGKGELVCCEEKVTIYYTTKKIGIDSVWDR